LLLMPNDLLFAALPDRVQIVDVFGENYPVLVDIPTTRNERDPIDIWYSATDDLVYFRPKNSSDLLQIDTANAATFTISVGRELDYADLRQYQGLQLSNIARIIGQPNSQYSNSLLRFLLGENYLSNYGNHPLTVILIDMLQPITEGEQQAALVYIFNDQTGRGTIEVLRPSQLHQWTLAPDGERLIARVEGDPQSVNMYNLTTGDLERTIVPSWRAAPEEALGVNITGEEVVTRFHRYSLETGAVLWEDLSIGTRPQQYTFTENNTLVTIFGDTWWEWDVRTGEPIRREPLVLRGDIWQTSPDARRFLTSLNADNGDVIMELVEVGMDQVRRVQLAQVPNRSIAQIVPSPNWEYFLVVYSPYQYSLHFPGNEIAMYGLEEGLMWFIAGDDLPHYENRYYEWIDNQTIYIYSQYSDGAPQPQRIYGLQYHASGLPQCLVDQFPDDYARWIDLWERLNYRLTAEALNRLTGRLCGVLPGTTEDVEAVFSPSPTPTRPPVVPTPNLVAGVPQCISEAFPGEALEYAEQWRALIDGRTPEEIAEMEILLCEGLRGGSAGVGYSPQPSTYSAPQEVMTIDIFSSVREIGSFVPPVERRQLPQIEPVFNEFLRTERYGFDTYSAVLSPDGQYLAFPDGEGFLDVFRLVRPYEDVVAEARATAAAGAPPTAQVISLAPTATQPFEVLGFPRPTFTPTVTPTSPPRADQPVELAQMGQVEDVCASQNAFFTPQQPHSDYAASGRILVQLNRELHRENNSTLWILDPATGEVTLDDTLPCPDCLGGLSPNQDWSLITRDGLRVVRPDGSDSVTLFGPYTPIGSAYWLDEYTIEYSYEEYVPERSQSPITFTQRYNVETREFSEPFRSTGIPAINELPTDRVSEQPMGGTVYVLRTPFNSGSGTGYRYYLYDQADGWTEYFARLSETPTEMTFVWHPRGRVLYYRYPNDAENTWYVFDPTTRQHRVFGALPNGERSRNGQLVYQWITLPTEEIDARLEAGQPIPLLSVWNDETGLTRRYCIPQITRGSVSARLYWSPDGRYVAFQMPAPAERELEGNRDHTYILDLQTGSVTDFGFDIEEIVLWIAD
jgi:hypothetical protein